MTDFIQDFLSMPLWFIIPLGIIYVASLAYILYILWHYRRNSLNAVLLTVALLVGQQAWAESSWEVKNNNGTSNTFTIKRSEKGYAQTVHFRTVSLSAYAGQHFTAVDMDYTFPADEDEKTVTVSEKTPAADAYAYKYQNGNTIRKYRFEVTDRGGFTLASADRTMITGTSFNADKVSQSITNLVYFNSSGNYTSGVNSSKYVDVSYTPPTSQVETSGTLNGYVLIDDSYDYAQKPATVSTSTLINSTNANATYLNDIGYKIYATVCFTEKEKDDGYQYIQIIAGDGSASYDTGYDPNKSVNDPVNSVYKTCFELSDGSNAEGKQYFPHRYDYANKSAETSASIGITEFSQTNGKLWQQKFKSGYQATNSGSLIFDANTSYITTRFDAGGDNDDTWGYKDLFVRMALVDASAPTKSEVSVNPGRHAKGNTVYVSVVFNEIVTVTGTPTLSTTAANNWGSLTYVEGSGTNVLTFSTTIPQDATGSLNITGFSGTITDLAGNAPSSISHNDVCTLDGDLVYTIDDFQQQGGNYLITCRDDLRGLAGYVNAGNNASGLTFLQVTNLTFPHTTNWNSSSSTENNFTSIGDDSHKFQGTFDGGGYTISGIRIYNDNSYQGLFGYIGSGGTVKRVTLADARITGYDNTGGIAGNIFKATIEDCTVGANVCIHAVKNGAYYHGGIVGNNEATVNRCISRATLTIKSGVTGCRYFGGIVGFNNGVNGGTISDCIALGVTIPNVNDRGAIVGWNNKGTLTHNYYYNCKVASSSVTPSGVGIGTNGSTATSDVAGARALYIITLGTDVTLVRSGTDLPSTNNKTNKVYDNGADIEGQPYGYEGATITLGYSGIGYQVNSYTATAGTIDGNTLTMPAEAVTVTANTTDLWGVESGCDGTTAAKAYTITTTAGLDLLATLVNSGNDFKGKFFRLGDNITYDHTTDWNDANSEENNYTAIGGNYNGSDKFFRGTFDGQGHTVSGIRIYKDGVTETNSEQGLFGCTWGATIKNVILADARITGKQLVGGIAGYITKSGVNGGIVENCRVGSDVTIHAVIDDARYHGGVVGVCENGTIRGCVSAATLTVASGLNNIYEFGGIVGRLDGNMSDCLAIGATVPAVNFYNAIAVTVGSSSQTNCYYRDCTVGANAHQSNAYTVSAGTDVTLAPAGDADKTYEYNGIKRYGSALYYGGVLYAPEDADVSLTLSYSVPAGLTLSYAASAGTLTGTSNPYTLTMPAEDVTINASLSVNYIDADGTEKSNPYADVTFLQSSNEEVYLGTDGEERWFAVSGNVSITANFSLSFYGSARLILCDGATLTLSGSNTLSVNGNLIIYGQSQGTGNLTAEGSGTAIEVSKSGILAADGTLTINGGSITAHSTGSTCIDAYNAVTINGGTVSATSDNQIGNGIISVHGDVTINGGTVNATGGDRSCGIKATNGSITLGWTRPTDRITASRYYANTISIKDGQTFTDGSGAAYSGTLNSDEISAISGQTLQPAVPVVFAKEGYGTAYYGQYDLVLPAGMKAKIVTDNNGDKLTYQTIADGDDTNNNVVPAATAVMLEVAATDASQTLGVSIADPEASAISATNYLHGSDTQCTTTGDGKHYKLSYNQGGTDIGWYWGTDDGAPFTSAAHKAWLMLPSTSAREFFGLPDDEGTTGIITIDHSPLSIDHFATDWYMLDGRKLQGMPTKKGIYIYKGKKVVLK